MTGVQTCALPIFANHDDQAGQNYGTTLLWTLALLIPVLYVNQEMVLRLGAVTGVGHARLIFERFGKFWGALRDFSLVLMPYRDRSDSMPRAEGANAYCSSQDGRHGGGVVAPYRDGSAAPSSRISARDS